MHYGCICSPPTLRYVNLYIVLDGILLSAVPSLVLYGLLQLYTLTLEPTL
jgi:hypothetical protein